MNIRKVFTISLCMLFAAACISSVVSKKPEVVQDNQETEGTIVPAVKAITISAAGDCTFGTDANAAQTKSFVETADENGTAYFMQNVKDIFMSDDLTIVNFEGTLSERGEREDKLFAFRGDPQYAKILTAGSIEAACLANNHSKDYGEISNSDTFDILGNEGIIAFDSTRTKVIDVNGVKVGLVGINQLNDVDRTRLETAINSVKSYNPDIIIAGIHWGEEKAIEPNDEQKEYGHRAVDLGADLVIGTHPHVLQGIEQYNGAYIAYSLGNFCFGGNDSPSDMDTVIYQQTFTFENGERNADAPIKLIPCTISSNYESGLNNYQPTPAVGAKRESIIQKMDAYNAALGNLDVSYN